MGFGRHVDALPTSPASLAARLRLQVASVPHGERRTSASKEGALVAATTMGFGRHVDALRTSPASLAARLRMLVASVPHGKSRTSATEEGALVAATTMGFGRHVDALRASPASLAAGMGSSRRSRREPRMTLWLRLRRTALHWWSRRRRRLVASVPHGKSRTSATKEGAPVAAITMGFGRHVDALHTSPASLAAGTG